MATGFWTCSLLDGEGALTQALLGGFRLALAQVDVAEQKVGARGSRVERQGAFQVRRGFLQVVQGELDAAQFQVRPGGVRRSFKALSKGHMTSSARP